MSSVPTVKEQVNEIIKEKVDNKESFTAYDITKEARKRILGVPLAHWMIRPTVKETFRNGEMPFYLARTAWFNGKEAIEYYPDPFYLDAEPSDEMEEEDAIQPNANSVAAFKSQKMNKSYSGAIYGLKKDYLNRLLIPNTYIKAIGLKMGMKVNLHYDEESDSLILHEDNLDIGLDIKLLGNYTVDKSNNVRIRNLDKISKKASDKFKVVLGVNDDLIISLDR